ncbi:MAG: penicillin-binding protein 1C [Ignavibacteria bacterium]|nr:penicillin-binding protein 1C [Ignavibacteria bacterium]
MFTKKYYFKNIVWIIESRAGSFLFAFLVLLLALDLFFPLPEPKEFSKVIYAKNGSLLSAYLTRDSKWRMKSSLDEVTPDLLTAIIEKEDKWFYWHFGINPIAVTRAFFQNVSSGRRVSGASTITMQLARMLEPSSRTYGKKFLEMLRALQLEMRYSKQEILEMYLSMLPYGGNIEGVKSASYVYFNRPPDKLSLSQSILLAVIPNDPNSFRLDKNATNAVRMRNLWIKKYDANNTFTKRDLIDAMNEPVSSSRYQVKNEAPHFSNYVAQHFTGDNIKSSLDYQIQKTAERLLSNYVNRVKSKNVSNGSLLIIDNKNNSVVGYCGSADFNDAASSGQVNGVIALRSPGSTLKPALYTLAFDNGILTPEMRLLDTPTDINGYEPENYDQKFNGEVTAKFALVNSLNIPAVRLLQNIGLEKFVSFLTKSGFADIEKQKRDLGLSVILGGCGIRLEQLTKLFAAFSHNGKLLPLNYLAKSANDENIGIKLFSPDASYITSQILTSNERPDFPAEFLYTTNLPKIAWKTGTSYGKRDAWAIGYNPDYTVGVWMGNFDGTGAPELSGAEMAVPLLFEIFNAIDYKPRKKWFDRPKDVTERDVCAETGLLLTESCDHYLKDYFIKRVSPKTKCNLYKKIYVDEKETIQYCPECLPNKGYKKVNYPMHSAELTLWYLKNKIVFKRPPPHNPTCQAKRSGGGPLILSPSADYEYFIEENSKQQILLQAASDASIKIQYWYINDQFYKSCKPGDRIFFQPQKGILNITCLDDLGRRAKIKTKVTIY